MKNKQRTKTFVRQKASSLFSEKGQHLMKTNQWGEDSWELSVAVGRKHKRYAWFSIPSLYAASSLHVISSTKCHKLNLSIRKHATSTEKVKMWNLLTRGHCTNYRYVKHTSANSSIIFTNDRWFIFNSGIFQFQFPLTMKKLKLMWTSIEWSVNILLVACRVHPTVKYNFTP